MTLPSVEARGRWKERGNPFRTEEWTKYVGSRLVAVSYVDALRPRAFRDLLLPRSSGPGPLAGNVQHPVARRRSARARPPARLTRVLRSGMPIIGIQA